MSQQTLNPISELETRWISNFFETCQIPSATRNNQRLIVAIGESGTLKSTLAQAYLAQAFNQGTGQPALAGAILFTSEGVTKSDLLESFSHWGVAATYSPKQVLVRPVLPRFISSNNFYFQIKVCIRYIKAQLRRIAKAQNLPPPKDWSCIRIVIDNWTSILTAHTALIRDPQLLQSLVRLLRNEGVLGYIVATQPGSPKAEQSPQRIHDVSQLEATFIHTWPVDFFGDRRIAISSSLPGSNEQRAKVFELAKDSNSPYLIKVLQDFDIYEDLESGKARRVDLKVKLYSGYHADSSLPKRTSATYINEVYALFGDLFPSSKHGQDVVSFESVERYDAFKEYIQNLESAKLSETLVFQVDEFWTCRNHADAPLADLKDYLDHSQTQTPTGSVSIFQPDMLTTNQRVPLHKDFGILLADRSAWYTARDIPIGAYRTVEANGRRLPFLPNIGIDIRSMSLADNPRLLRKLDTIHTKQLSSMKPLTVGDVWNSLCVAQDRFPEPPTQKPSVLSPCWSLFLLAARNVAMRSGKYAFDVDLRTSETLSSLCLEIWLSRVLDQRLEQHVRDLKANPNPKEKPGSIERFQDIWKLFSEPDHYSLDTMQVNWSAQFEYAIRLLASFLPSRFHEYDLKLAPAESDVVAFRTWFAPAVVCQSANRNLAPLRLPGRMSVRGDWFLGVARGSRSMRLATNAIDKLVSEGMNLKRLRDGVGLPSLQLNNRGPVESALTTPDPFNNTFRRLTLKELEELEPTPVIPHSRISNLLNYRLLSFYRSRIHDYDPGSSEFFLKIANLLRTESPLNEDTLLV